MVHALEEIRRLLKSDGQLIDIQPIRTAPFITVYQGRKLLFSESDPGYDYDMDLQHAGDALDDVVRRGLFLIEGNGEFNLITYASSVADLRDFWKKVNAYDDSPKEEAAATRQDEMYARADAIMRSNEGREVAYHEKARITRLKPNTMG